MLGRPSNDPQLMTYRSYLDSFLLPFRVGSDPETQRHNSHTKNVRQSYKRKFTEPGQPGEMFRHGSFPPSLLSSESSPAIVSHVQYLQLQTWAVMLLLEENNCINSYICC